MLGTTIAAIATAQAPAGIGIVRLSGCNARRIADLVFRAKSGRIIQEMKGYTAAFGYAFDSAGEKIDEVIALVFVSPYSYTGEDVVELSCHGGVVVMRRLLQAVFDAGAVPAAPGEFTRRAFENGKMDLTKAESIMQLISSSGEQAAKAAVSAMDGKLSAYLSIVSEDLIDLAAHLAAWSDFPDEEIPQITEVMLTSSLTQAIEALNRLLDTYESGQVIRNGVNTVIAGRTNAGKSTLMNLLSGCKRSIVSEYAGTTRDVVEESVFLGHALLHLSDTAGIRESNDPVESMGIQLSFERIERAQLVFAVFDGSQNLTEEDRTFLSQLSPDDTVIIINKSDLGITLSAESFQALGFADVINLSAQSGAGLSDLQNVVEEKYALREYDPSLPALYSARQLRAVKLAKDALQEALQIYRDGLTLDAVTVCIEEALQAFAELSGKRVSEQIVQELFENFCVGK